MDRRQTDLKLAHNFEKDNNVEKAQLPINNDTSFDIYYDICEIENTKYLYIKIFNKLHHFYPSIIKVLINKF